VTHCAVNVVLSGHYHLYERMEIPLEQTAEPYHFFVVGPGGGGYNFIRGCGGGGQPDCPEWSKWYQAGKTNTLFMRIYQNRVETEAYNLDEVDPFALDYDVFDGRNWMPET